MATTKIINDLAGFNQSGSPNALKGCVGDTSEQPASSSSIDYVIVGGGGGAGGGIANSWGGGGGGAGGYLTGSTTVYHGTPTVLTIGEGGDGNNVRTAPGFNGDDSGFNGIRAIGGGGGGAEGVPGTGQSGIDGGSGGGAGGSTSTGTPSYAGVSLPVINAQGYAGGAANTSIRSAAGGGGAGAAGASPTTALVGGAGGIGVDINAFISSTSANLAQIGEVISTNVYVCGGGGGAADYQAGGTGGAGGDGGGGAGGNDGTDSGNGIAGTSNTGGGGGGGNADPSTQALGGTGGSGVIALKYDNTAVTGYSLNSGNTYTINWPADKYGIAYWPLNLNVKDVGGNFNGTATDISYIDGKFNQAASFNGSTSVVEFTDNEFIDSEYTVCAWIKTDNATSASNQTIWGNTGYVLGLTFQGVIFHINNTALRVQQYPVGTTSSTATGLIASDTWYHVALSYTSTQSKIYLNGELVLTANVDGPGYITSYPMTPSIGAYILEGYSPRVWEFFDGAIEQVRLYANILSLTDIQNIYNNSKPGSLALLKPSSDVTTGQSWSDNLDFPSGATAVALYEFESNGDSTDSASNNQTTVGTITYSIGKFGEAASGFSASNYFATSGLVGTLLGTTAAKSFTISAWIKTPTNGGNEQAITGNTAGSSTSGASLYIRTDGRLTFLVSAGGSNGGNGNAGGPYAYTEQVVADNTWHHIAATYSSDGTTSGFTRGVLGLFVDGINVTPSATFLQSGASWTNGTANPWSTWGDNYFRTGRWDSGTNHLDGSIDQLRIYQSVLTDAQIYDLWQKENDIQTYFADTPTAGTDTLVFKEGSGDISFTNDTTPGAELGMIRTNTDLSGAGSTSQLEYFSPGGWKTLNNSTVDICNYPTTARCLYKFDGDVLDSCGNTTVEWRNAMAYTGGKFNRKGWDLPGVANQIGFTGIYWPLYTGLGIDYNAEDFSLSLWLKLNAYGTYNTDGNWGIPYIWTGWSKSYWTLAMDRTTSNNTISFNTWGPSAGQVNNAESGVVDLHTWYHIVCTRSTTDGIKLYLNNELVASVTGAFSAGPAGSSAEYDAMGGYGNPAYSRYGVNGTISQFRLFPSELNATQVSQLYNEISL